MGASFVPFDLPVNEIQLYGHEWCGGGDAIVLLHGTGLVGMLWAPIAARLASETNRVVAFDLRGHGGSEKPASGYAWDTLASDIEQALESLRLNRVCLVGHSLGGSLAVLLAASRPDLIERCIVIDPVVRKPNMFDHDPFEPGVPTAELALVRRATWPNTNAAREFLAAKEPYASWTKESLDLFVRYGIEVQIDGTARLICPPAVEAEIYRQRQSFNPWAYLPRIRCPSLFIYGTDPRPDVLAAPANVTEIVPDSRVVHLRGGHFVPFEDPDSVFEAIRGFLNSEPTAG